MFENDIKVTNIAGIVGYIQKGTTLIKRSDKNKILSVNTVHIKWRPRHPLGFIFGFSFLSACFLLVDVFEFEAYLQQQYPAFLDFQWGSKILLDQNSQEKQFSVLRGLRGKFFCDDSLSLWHLQSKKKNRLRTRIIRYFGFSLEASRAVSQANPNRSAIVNQPRWNSTTYDDTPSFCCTN